MSSLTVVITTHNRPEGVRRAVRSVQAVETGMDTTIIVVDDGSRPDVAVELQALAGPGVLVVRQDDLGLCAARRHGVALTASTWLTFLDDDDEWLPSWERIAARVREEPQDGSLAAGTLVLASGGASLWSPEGRHLSDEPPRPQGRLYSDLDVQYLAGCWLVRRDVYDLAGGYLPGLSASHQSELFIRLGAIIDRAELATVSTPTAVTRIERRDNGDRALSDPKVLYDGLRWVLARHRSAFLCDPPEHANWLGWAATNGARCGAPDAAALALEAATTDFSPKRVLRAAAMATPARRLIWPLAAPPAGSPSNAAPLPHTAALRALDEASPVPGLAPVDALFLPWNYLENPQASSDTNGTPFWGEPDINDVRMQAPVYRLVARRLRGGAESVLDIGCGSGDKLVRYVAPAARRWWGVDQPSAIAEAERRWGSAARNGGWLAADLSPPASWDDLFGLRPDVVMCVDVIEHLDDPFELLARLRTFALDGAAVILSTPDRSRLEGISPLGPPRNHRHVREWSESELRLLVESADLQVQWCRHLLPRTYSPSLLEAKRLAHRLLHAKPLPDRRSCMVMGLVAAHGPVSRQPVSTPP